MERFQFPRMPVSLLVVLLLLGSVPLSAFAALAGNPQLNNNYFGQLNDYQKALLQNNEEHHLDVAITKLASGYSWEIPNVKQQLVYFLPRWPNHPKALQIVSEVARRTHDPAYALKWYTKAIDAFPQVYQTYVLYGVYLFRIEQYKKAEKEFRVAVKLAPETSEPNYDLGLTLFKQKKYDEANRYAQRAYRLGYPLSGLRDLLKGQGAWKPVSGSAVTTPAKPRAVGGHPSP